MYQDSHIVSGKSFATKAGPFSQLVLVVDYNRVCLTNMGLSGIRIPVFWYPGCGGGGNFPIVIPIQDR